MPMHITPDNVKTHLEDFEVGLSTATLNDTTVPVAVVANNGHVLALFLPELDFLIEELTGLRERLKTRLEQELKDANLDAEAHDPDGIKVYKV